jgi:hypothetical protein
MERDATPRVDSPTAAANPPAVSAASAARGFPLVGIAVRDTASAWCAAFPPDSANRQPAVGDSLAIVFASADAPASLDARIAAPRSAQCHAEFAQPRWHGYTFYDLAVTQPVEGVNVSSVALAVVSPARWTSRDGRVMADLDGNGAPEEARRCAAHEGEHFTIWSALPGEAPVRRAHEYYDWGAEVEATCNAGDDGR